MPHPPIPPKCEEYFMLEDKPKHPYFTGPMGWFYWIDRAFPEYGSEKIYWPLESIWVYYPEKAEECRQRAMTAWKAEAAMWANTPVNDCKHFDDISNWRLEAEINAEAWEKWTN